jgi:hypothetical protein
MLDRCRSLTWMESLELQIRAPHGRRRGSCFGCRSLVSGEILYISGGSYVD